MGFLNEQQEDDNSLAFGKNLELDSFAGESVIDMAFNFGETSAVPSG